MNGYGSNAYFTQSNVFCGTLYQVPGIIYLLRNQVKRDRGPLEIGTGMQHFLAKGSGGVLR